MSNSRRERGFTLIEMIIAIVVLGIGLTGVLVAYQTVVRGSADALVGKQLVAIAEEMMEEVLLKPHSLVVGGAGATDCGAGASRSAFDDVGDYNGYQTPNICDIDGDAVPGLNGYAVAVAVVLVNMEGIANTMQVSVTATHGAQSFVLQGFKVPLP